MALTTGAITGALNSTHSEVLARGGHSSSHIGSHITSHLSHTTHFGSSHYSHYGTHHYSSSGHSSPLAWVIPIVLVLLIVGWRLWSRFSNN